MVKEKKETVKVKELKHQSRKHSIKEGIFASIKGAFGDYYVSPFAIAINASNSLVALFGAITGLLGPISQLFGSKLIEKYSRKKITLKFIFLEALAWLPFIIIALLFYRGIWIEALPFLLLFSFALYSVMSNIVKPAWFSWAGDIVNAKQRGRWFAKRHLIMGFVLVIVTILASIFLDYFTKQGWIMAGFMILFGLAFLARITCWKITKKQYEPKIKLKKGYYFSFFEFIINAPKNNFGKFTIFRSFIAFAASISSPLLAVYLLRNLGFNYTLYMGITLAGTFFSLIIMDLWGKFADKYGNYKAIVISCIIIPLIPILWILAPSPTYLIFVPALLGGVAWAGFNLSASNFIYDNVSQQKRGLVVSYYNLLIGIGIFLGAGLGAFLIKFLKTSFIEPIILIFILGSVIRIFVILIGLPRIKEVRRTAKFSASRAFKNIIIKEAKPTLHEEVHEIISIKEYLHIK